MKILVIHQYFLEKEGVGISRFNQFVKYWVSMGHEVTIVCGMVHYMTGEKPLKYQGKFITKEYSGLCTVVRAYVSDAYNKNFFGRMFAYLSFTLSSTFAVFTIPKHDIVIATSPPLHAGIAGIIARTRWKIPLIFEVRDIWPDSAIEIGVLTNTALIRLAYWLERHLYAVTTRIVVLTPAFREVLVAKKGVPQEKIVCVPNGADADLLVQTVDRGLIRELVGLRKKCIALYIGAHGVANHLDQLLDAAHLLRDEEDIVFLLIGSGMKKRELVERAERERLKNVYFLDPVPKEHIANYIYASDIGLAVLKKLDIFKTVYPNKVFDYMACKKPTVVAIDGAARTLVEDAKAGIFANPEDPYSLSLAIRTLARSRELREEYGENGYAFVTEHFSREAIAKRYSELLNAVLH